MSTDGLRGKASGPDRPLGKLASLLAIIFILGLNLGTADAAAAASETNMQIVGRLETGADNLERSRLVVADKLGLLVEIRPESAGSFSPLVQTWDLESLKPRGSLTIADGGLLIGSGGPPPQALSLVDESKGQILVFGATDLFGTRTGTILTILDAKTLRVERRYDLSPALGGAKLAGVDLDSALGKLYLIAEAIPGLGYTLQSSTTQVLQYDLGNGGVDWSLALPQCQRMLMTGDHAVAFGKSQARPLLYVACGLDSGDGATYLPGVQAVFRVAIEPSADTARASSFRIDTFPIGGEYHASLFDPRSERVFMISEEYGNAGAWIFDGAREAWLGNLALPDNIKQMGHDVETGRLYLAGLSGLMVAEGRALPLAQGLNFEELGARDGGAIAIDRSLRRVFLKKWAGNKNYYTIVRDGLADYRLPAPEDPDARTLQHPETAGVTGADFSSGGRAYGARILFVGGTGGLQRNLTGYDAGRYINNFTGGWPSFFWPTTGDRDLFFGSVDKAFLSRVGESSESSASAIGIQRDSNTDSDFTALSQQTGYESLEWPWERSDCSDFGEKAAAKKNSGYGAGSQVDCASSEKLSEASAWADGFDGLPITIAAARANLTARLDDALGAITEARSEAKSITIDAGNNAGRIEIGRVGVVASTRAKGISGTADSTFTRFIEQAKVTDGSGNVVFQCAEADTCDPKQFASAANGLAGAKMQFFFPEPDPRLRRSPGGFQAVVQEGLEESIENKVTNNDEESAVAGMVVVGYHDGAGRSRMMVELAAVRVESHYGIYLLPTLTQNIGGGITGGVLGPIENFVSERLGQMTLPQVKGSTAGPQLPSLPDLARGVVRGVKLVLSSPGEFVLTTAFWSMMALPAYMFLRRRALLRGKA